MILSGGRWRRRLVLLGAVLLLVTGALGASEARRRQGLYWYDVGQDHRYEFAGASPATVTVDRRGLTLPDLDPAESTAMVCMRISTTLAGRWFEPALEIEGPDGSTNVQFFERGARGQRWINLGNVLGSTDGSVHVELRGRHLRWDEQEASLWVFPAPPVHAGPVLVIAPHPDDAEIAAFGLYAAHDSWIVTISSGNRPDPRWAHLIGDAAAREALVGEARAFDSVAIPRWGGVAADRALNLGYPNGDLARLQAQADPAWARLVDELVRILLTAQPRTIVAPHPRLDAASDHRLTTLALVEALERAGPAGRTLLLYTNHPATSEYFPFGPAHGLVSLPPWTQAPLWAQSVYSFPLDTEQRLRKLIALDAHHDLRPPPRFADPSPLGRVLGELTRTVRELWRDPADSYSYLRRAPRPNELFLVFHEDDVPRLRADVTEFLAAPGDGGESSPEDRVYHR